MRSPALSMKEEGTSDAESFPLQSSTNSSPPSRQRKRCTFPWITKGPGQYKEWKGRGFLPRPLNTVRSAKDFFFRRRKTGGVQDPGQSHRSHRFPQRIRRFRNFRRTRLRCPTSLFWIKYSWWTRWTPTIKSRREHGTISLACTRPEETCFCPLFGINAAEPEERYAAAG